MRVGMVEHPAEYRWLSYRANAQGKEIKLVTPPPLYESLSAHAAALMAGKPWSVPGFVSRFCVPVLPLGLPLSLQKNPQSRVFLGETEDLARFLTVPRNCSGTK